MLDRLLEGARGGDGGVLVVHGEPGVGKTALLEYAVEAGHEYRVARASGVEGEMELPSPRSNSCARPSSSWRSAFRNRSAMRSASPSG